MSGSRVVGLGLGPLKMGERQPQIREFGVVYVVVVGGRMSGSRVVALGLGLLKMGERQPQIRESGVV